VMPASVYTAISAWMESSGLISASQPPFGVSPISGAASIEVILIVLPSMRVPPGPPRPYTSPAKCGRGVRRTARTQPETPAMPRILIAECMQEISSFNPLQSGYDHFSVQRGEELYRQATLNSAVGGALAVFRGAPGVETVPAYSARAGSAGLLSAAGWKRLSEEFVAGVTANIDGIYGSLHGAMGADGELDPEGFLLTEVRRLAGPRVPIVISLDLHGILTDRMLRQIDGLTLHHTYPHVDF